MKKKKRRRSQLIAPEKMVLSHHAPKRNKLQRKTMLKIWKI